MLSDAKTTERSPRGLPARVPFYYGWVVMAVAALAMVGTLPGRTQGLGLVTEPLLKDLKLDRVEYADMNLWSTLLGSLFCLGIGRPLDLLGSRAALTIVSLALGSVVLAMSRAQSGQQLFFSLVLCRGLGQSALSVVSLTMVGQWFRRRLNLAMALYSVLLSMGFMLAFPIIGGAVERHGWRTPWAGFGLLLVMGLAPLGLFLVRRDPESCGIPLEGEAAPQADAAAPAFKWLEALATPAFWVFALASSAYNLVVSGIGLFNESILAEHGFDPGIYHRSLVITALTSLLGNFLGGWLASKWSVKLLMAIAMALLAGALVLLPSLESVSLVSVFALVMGLAGGFVIVIFFSFWADAFGREQLGRIQGTAQMMTVLASSLGPVVLARCQSSTGSYSSVFYWLGGIVALLGLAAALVRMPQRRRAAPIAERPSGDPAPDRSRS